MPLLLDETFYQQGYKSIAGCDEAGRGPLAGPVVAACVVLPKDFFHPLINDSKKLTSRQRLEAFTIIKKHALSFAYTVIDPVIIDQINILEASRKAMIESVKKISVSIDVILTDAMAFSFQKIPVFPFIKGDTQSLAIASASIVAKVMRDQIMEALDEQYPHYQFKKHKGYPTRLHQALLAQYGPLPGIHRYSFAPVKKLL
jgi:ribonuclease HII